MEKLHQKHGFLLIRHELQVLALNFMENLKLKIQKDTDNNGKDRIMFNFCMAWMKAASYGNAVNGFQARVLFGTLIWLKSQTVLRLGTNIVQQYSM
jgi:hypothetical protein